jgi:GNAT superfamily N-acetyltransferase
VTGGSKANNGAMDEQQALGAFDEQLRANLRDSVSGGRFERDGVVVRCVGATPDDWSGIDWADLDETTADDVVAEQVRYFTELGRGFEWKYYAHDRPADLPHRLLRAGFEPEPEEALMVADIADVPLDHEPPDGVRLVSVTDAAGVALVIRVHEEVFGDDRGATGRAMLRQLEDTPPLLTPVLAMAGDVPVSSSRIDFHDGTEFASLWGGGTLEAWRGKGIYRAMVSYRARLAMRRGARYLRVDALPTSRPILERLGFVQLSTTVPYQFSPR